MTLLVQTVKPHMSVFIRSNVQLFKSTIGTFLHNIMEVKTVLNLEADTRDRCQDTVTHAE